MLYRRESAGSQAKNEWGTKQILDNIFGVCELRAEGKQFERSTEDAEPHMPCYGTLHDYDK